MRLTPERAIKYSRSVMEVLAIIAYRQPVIRGDIEKIRGVSLNPNALRQLIEREWVEIIGQKEVPGRRRNEERRRKGRRRRKEEERRIKERR